MIIKLEELPRMAEALVSLSKRDFKAKTAYRISKITKKVLKEFEIFNEQRMKLIRKYGLKDEKGELIKKDGHYLFKDREAFDAEIEELLKTEIQLNVETLSIEDFGDCELSPLELSGLGRLIKEE